jgi:vacuolar-type H+-ATPase subunit I/STV1
MQKQIKEMRECNLHLNNKQIMYVIFYTYKVQKLLDPKFNYTLALAQGKITEALEHANKKGIDLLSFDEDYFKPEKQKMQDETLDLTNEIKRKNNEKELSQKNKEQYKKELEIRNKKFQEEFLNAPIKKIEERDVENFLIDHLELVEEGLSFIDHQVEVTNGVIDIIARDKTDTLCIIEVKNKKDAKDLVFQVNYYPTCFNEKLRMIVIAPEYSDRILQVLKKVPNIELYCFNAFLGTKGHPINKLDIRKIS